MASKSGNLDEQKQQKAKKAQISKRFGPS